MSAPSEPGTAPIAERALVRTAAPVARARGALQPESERRLAARPLLSIDARRGIAVKRNQHEFVLAASVDAVVTALAGALARPGASFGPIDVRRVAAQVGQPFRLGERFCSVVSLERLLAGGRLARWLRPLWRSRWWTLVAERWLGDFAEISVFDVDGAGARRVCYRYLAGCPMAGESEYRIEPLPDGQCRLRVTFTFQELGGLAITILHRFGLRVHDQAVLAQVRAVAAELGVAMRTGV